MNLKGWPYEPLGESLDNDVCGGGEIPAVEVPASQVDLISLNIGRELLKGVMSPDSCSLQQRRRNTLSLNPSP